MKCPHCQAESAFLVRAPVADGEVEHKRRWWIGPRRPVVVMRTRGAIVECIGCSGISALLDDRGRVIPRRYAGQADLGETNGRRDAEPLDSDLRQPIRVR